MSDVEFSNVSVLTNANVSYKGRCSSHTILFEDGSKKMLGLMLPNNSQFNSYFFETNTSERMEIISGECQVKFKDEDDYIAYRTGQAFMVAGNSSFKIKTNEVMQYICHLEG